MALEMNPLLRIELSWDDVSRIATAPDPLTALLDTLDRVAEESA